ncbi:hypothetical protein F442_04940 [Phytophthora nicotianae P10297]|uniref:Uncharacterized protein n=6 Tax=Phytophthora nicotianae TaxID=4792 RepID=W2QGD8_PHYN3|nr:hypothetical protein PPTG_09119 [Phytophthora nicotianae INRA-310]ETI51858.1 hypothetical protein F443_04873 [Phytophthora nicotianae P1569]ETK91747.1 hypothetical protein L915_04739 [Phytophthora nicotianae]ETO80610.1 hypothetical protein F444_04911 [Phytophthora nicotianae P1976]ETP49532.1 hypothetical protein F442_04940 [Phytophthora nicotianae P10297]ETM51473.1 hypothetical protein L914_04692 [Phytophthora nicotianae]
MPSTAVRFGPFNYPVLHIWHRDNGNNSGNSFPVFTGLKGVQPVSAARVWSYQYDSTSVGLRGAVELLNVTEFPSFLLYKPLPGQPATNATSLVDLGTVFSMLDALITASRTHLRPTKTNSPVLRYATKHNWIDRLHHYLAGFAAKNYAWRLHSLHAPNISHNALAICSKDGFEQRSTPRPRFCNHPGIWKCKHPLNASLPDVRLWDHMDLRLQSLQQQYPDLRLDVVVVSSQRPSSTSGGKRSTFYIYEALEIVVLTRGRRCVEDSGTKITTCMAVFVDDYRYERDIVRTNLVDWYRIVSILRGGAQVYVWIRVLLLGYGAYTATWRSNSRLVSMVSIVFKIPFQVIVYSSLLPVSMYVGALVLDNSFTDIFLDSYWASVGGAVNLKWVPFIQTTSVQMRCVWLLALLASGVLFAMRRLRCNGEGILGIRGLVISLTASLTVFGPYKSVYYRDMNITSIFRIPDEGPTMDIVRSTIPGDYLNSSSYFFGNSLKTMRLCVTAVGGCAMAVKLLGYMSPTTSRGYHIIRGMIFRFSQISPYGIERLWTTTSPIIHFRAPIRLQKAPNTPTSKATNRTQIQYFSPVSGASRVVPSPPPNARGSSRTFLTTDSSSHRCRWYSWLFCCVKDIAEDFRRTQLLTGALTTRSIESHSIVQLMNIAMMTDPWNFFWLRAIGVQLYLYQIRPSPGDRKSFLPFAVILPYAPDEIEERTGLSVEDYELLDSASSRDVPMFILLQCG